MANATLNQLNYKGTLYDIEDSEARNGLATKADADNVYTKNEVDTTLSGKVDKETGKRLSTNDYTDTEKTKLAGIAEGAEVNVQSNWTQTTTTADDYIKNKPTLGTAAAKNATDTYDATGTDVTTGKAVAAALATLPEPMVFKGSLGTGGTITTLPTASSSNKGYVYKVITAGTYASQSAKVGDTFISDGSVWVLIPSGDEPSGTVTNVAVANGGGLTVSGSPITSSGTITVGHSNSVTAKTSSSLKKFTYDAHGHVTDSSELSTAESNALASGIDSTKVEQISTNQTNIGKVQTQALIVADQTTQYNYSSVSSMSGTSGFSSIYYFDKPIPIGTYRLVCTNVRTDTSKQCQFQIVGANASEQYTNLAPTISTANYVTNEFTTTFDLYGIKVYCNTPIEITNLAIIPKALYDVGFTSYQPYALSNVKLTPALIECVDSVAKNELELITPYGSGITNNPNLTVTLNSDQTITVNGSATTSGVIVISNTISGKLGKYLSGRPVGVTADIRLTAYSQPSWSTAGNDYNGKGATITDNGNILITIYVIAGQTYSNLTFKPMICTKSAWDVSQKFVPYRPTYEDTVEQVAENENNILLLERMNGAKNLAPYSGESHSSTGFFFIHSNCIDIAAGEQVYLVYDYTQTAGQISIQLTDGNGNIISGTASYSTAGTTEGHKATKITIPTGYTAKGYNANQGSAGNVSISNFMIVSAEIYEAGFTDYQPYAMTNAEITEWILAHS